MKPTVVAGTKPTAQESKLLRLAELLSRDSYSTIRPYFLRYLPESLTTEVHFEESLFQDGFMAARRSKDGGNLLVVSLSRVRKLLDIFMEERGSKPYACAYFLGATTHEYVHFAQPLESREHEKNFGWAEGTAYLVSWLILSEFYPDSP